MKEKRKGKYGYVEFVDKRKFRYDGYDDNIEPEFRKPTPAEREEIILNFIRAHSGKSIRIWWLAEKLGVSDNIQDFVSALIASAMIGGKALGKEFGISRSTKIVHSVGKIINKFQRNEKGK